VADVEPMLRRLIGEHIDLSVALDSRLGTVRADPSQFETVVVNLAVNARDAMPGGGRLTIETSNVDLDGSYASEHVDVTPGGYVLLAVSDTGAGMDPATRDRVFEPFFTTKEPGRGTGLGLATVYGIVKQSGGHATVYSEPGRGTAFKIYLPRAEAPAAEAAEVPPAAPRGGTETILLVEDDEVVRALVREMLERHGYSVIEAGSGAEALRLCGRGGTAVDLVVTDVVMPGMSGSELAEQLSALYPGIRVLHTSGYTDEAFVQHGVLLVGAAFLQKPFSMHALATKVREVLEK
jgi:two-component system cell cycle sensor histidine kinase/response regulator CckA